MDGIKRDAMTPTRPQARAGAALHKATDAASTSESAAPPVDQFHAGTKRKAFDTAKSAMSESVAPAPAPSKKEFSTTQRKPRKSAKRSLPDLEATSAQPTPRVPIRSRVASLRVVKEAHSTESGPHSGDAMTVVLTRANGAVEHIDLRRAQLPDYDAWSRLMDRPEAEPLQLDRKFVILHALLRGFVPALQNTDDAEDILHLIDSGAAKRAADDVVVMLACSSSEAFLDYFLTIWRNPNASDMEMIVFPALTICVQQNRLPQARILVRHGADPLLDRVNLLDALETVVSPWERVFFQHRAPGSIRFGSQEMEDLLRAAIVSSGRTPPEY